MASHPSSGHQELVTDAEAVLDSSGALSNTDAEPAPSVHTHEHSTEAQQPLPCGSVSLTLSFEDREEKVTIPDPNELPQDLALSPSQTYLLRFVRENIQPCLNRNRSETDMGLSEPCILQFDNEQGEDTASNMVDVTSQHTQQFQIPPHFSPNGVKGLLTKISRAIDIGPINQRRTYTFHNRVKKHRKSPPMKRKLRLQRALRGENPFLNQSTELYCCDRYRCFEKICPHYLFEEYKKVNSMNKVQAKRYLIALFHASDRLWYVRGIKVCSRFLQKAFGFSTDLQCQVKGTPGARATPTPRSLPREVRRKTKRSSISDFILKLAGRFAEAMPHKQEFALPVFTKTMLWNEFVKYWNEEVPNSRGSAPSKSYFFRIWKLYATMVKVQKRHCFTVCSRCEMLRYEMTKHLRDEETLNVLIEQYSNHLRFIERERDGYEKRQNLAEENPNKYCSIILDGADQKNYGLPHFPKQTKSDTGHKLKVKIVGCLEHVLRGGEELSLYAMTEEYATGANHVIEVAHRVLHRKKEVSGKLPPTLFVQVDNCGRENKNRYFFAYFQSLIHLGVFKTVQVSFLPIGHTHADIDQAFSSIAAHLRINEAFTFEEMLLELSKCYAGRAKAFSLDGIVNYSDLCESSGCLTSAEHFTEYRYFRFVSKEREGNNGLFSATCDVKVKDEDDWVPFPTERAEGFLKFVPNFRNTPNTKTKELPNFSEVTKCLNSAEERIKDDSKIEALRAMRDKVFEVREEPFHWNVDRIFEMHGEYLSEVGDTIESDSHVEQQLRTSCGYDPNDFVAVETNEDPNTKFWIARVKSVCEFDLQGRAKMLTIRWYVPSGGDPWNAKYIPAWKITRGEKSIYEDTIDVACVILRFNSFTTAGKLRVADKKAIKQMLNDN